MNKVQPSHTAYDYYHFSTADRSKIDLKRQYPQTAKKLVYHSPNGLWLSVAGNNDWEHYSIKNGHKDDMQSKFRITLKPEASILLLHNQAAFTVFETNYGYYKEDIPKQGDNYTLTMSLAWDRIISDYQGIVVSSAEPKLYDVGLWYDVWCCTSACIWDLKAVKKAEKMDNI